MNARCYDTKLFYQLVKKQRAAGNVFITDLHVNHSTYTEDDILKGWNIHFSNLATSKHSENYDELSHEMVLDDVEHIVQLVQKQGLIRTSSEEVIKAIKTTE